MSVSDTSAGTGGVPNEGAVSDQRIAVPAVSNPPTLPASAGRVTVKHTILNSRAAVTVVNTCTRDRSIHRERAESQ